MSHVRVLRRLLAAGGIVVPWPALCQTAAPTSRAAAPPAAGVRPASDSSARLSVSGELRARAEGYHGGGFNAANHDAYLLTRILLGARVQAAPAVSFFVQGMDARAPGKLKLPAGPPFRDHADLRQGYVQVGRDNASWLRAGRLDLAFGDGRLVGSLPWANTMRSFDGARTTLVGHGSRVDLFATSVVKIDQDRFDRNVPGSTFYGAYGVLPTLMRNGTLELFVFWRRQSRSRTELGAPGTMNVGTAGIHGAGKLPARVDYDLQMALQSGRLGDESVRAWAGHWLLGYTPPGTRPGTRLFAEYNYATGDANPADHTRGTFDQLYPTGHDKYGLTDLVGWQNMRHARGGLEIGFPRGVAVTARYNAYWLADPHDALYNGAGVPLARAAAGNAGTSVGQEVDAIVNAQVRRRLGFSAGIGRFLPGTFLERTTRGDPYTYSYGMLTFGY